MSQKEEKVQQKNLREKAKQFCILKFDFIFSVDIVGQSNNANSGIYCRAEDVALAVRN